MSWLTDPITDEWLKEVGFRWHQFDCQPDKQWLLWLGDALREDDHWSLTSYEDLGIELAFNKPSDNWFCWMRADYAGRYGRFLHVRHLKQRGEVIQLIVALSGCSWEPKNHINGCLLQPEHAESRRREMDRLDRRIALTGHPWTKIEEDDSRGRPLPQHMEAAIKNGGAT